MRAARLYGVRDLRVEEIDDPSPGPGEALIRIHACGVCPSDIRSYVGARAPLRKVIFSATFRSSIAWRECRGMTRNDTE